MVESDLKFRSIFVSDVHLGSAGSMVDEFCHFLTSVECENLYLVGDIVDIWMMMKAGKWQQSHTDAVEMILNKTKQGVKVFYTPGNHDAFVRNVNNSVFGNLSIKHSFEHVTADGKKLQVVHGDLFDKSVRFVPVAWLAAWGYEGLTVLNNKLNAKRLIKGKSEIEFSSVFKKRLKRFIGRRTDFEEILLEQAVGAGFDGVVCGHIHKAQIRKELDGTMYINTGDWVEHGTAIVEHFDGKIELWTWKDNQSQFQIPRSFLAKEHSSQTRQGGFVECVRSGTKDWA